LFDGEHAVRVLPVEFIDISHLLVLTALRPSIDVPFMIS
jgi:hypothetical protein